MKYAVYILRADRELEFISGPFTDRFVATNTGRILEKHDKRRFGFDTYVRPGLERFLHVPDKTREFVVREYSC